MNEELGPLDATETGFLESDRELYLSALAVYGSHIATPAGFVALAMANIKQQQQIEKLEQRLKEAGI